MKNSDNLIHSFKGDVYGESNLNGLTKREYFAGLAMQGLCVSFGDVATSSSLSKKAIAHADELLKQLESTDIKK